jgi:hypothetical protein
MYDEAMYVDGGMAVMLWWANVAVYKKSKVKKMATR